MSLLKGYEPILGVNSFLSKIGVDSVSLDQIRWTHEFEAESPSCEKKFNVFHASCSRCHLSHCRRATILVAPHRRSPRIHVALCRRFRHIVATHRAWLGLELFLSWVWRFLDRLKIFGQIEDFWVDCFLF